MIRELVEEYKNLFGNKKLILLRAILCYIRIPKYRVIVLIRCAIGCKSNFYRRYFRNKLAIKYGVEVGSNPKIGKNLQIMHYNGVVIGNDVVIGDNCMLYQQVTLGQKEELYPVIGDNVIIYPGTKIIGDVKVGDYVIVGANSVVVKDIPNNKIVAGVPSKVIGERGKYV